MREFEEIIEFRLAVEPMAARLAAERRTKTDLAALKKAFEWVAALAATGAEGAVSDWVRADGEYHLADRQDLAQPRGCESAIEESRAGMFMPIGAVFGRLESHAHLMHDELYHAIVNGDARPRRGGDDGARPGHADRRAEPGRPVARGAGAARRPACEAGSLCDVSFGAWHRN